MASLVFDELDSSLVSQRSAIPLSSYLGVAQVSPTYDTLPTNCWMRIRPAKGLFGSNNFIQKSYIVMILCEGPASGESEEEHKEDFAPLQPITRLRCQRTKQKLAANSTQTERKIPRFVSTDKSGVLDL